jgi:DNA-binding transcriptional ArsR family regulator
MRDSGLNDILRENILPYIRDDVWFQDSALERAMWELTELRERMDRFDEQRSVVARELAVLIGQYAQVLAKPKKQWRVRALREMAITTRRLQRQLFFCYKSFLRNSYRRYSYTETQLFVEEEAVRGFREALVDRFESSIEPDVKKTLDIMRAFIDRLEKENYE